MTDQLQSYRQLIEILNSTQSPSSDIRWQDVDWDRLIQVADQEGLGPRLYQSLSESGLIKQLPEGSRAAFKRRFLLNTMLNEKIKLQAIEIVAVLNELDIEPIIIKGGLHLFESEPGALGTRVMGDLDIIISAPQMDLAVERLGKIGFEPDEAEEDWTYHYRPLIRKGSVPIDVHQHVGEQKSILSYDEAARAASVVLADNLKLRSLCPTHRIFHNIFHSQIQDRAHELGALGLKQLLDLSNIVMQHGDAIDWHELSVRMKKGRLIKVWNARMFQMAVLLDLPMPPGMTPTMRAKFHNWRCFLQLRQPWLIDVAKTWAGATHPFKRHAMDLIYGCGSNPVIVAAYRVRYAGHMLWKYRGQLRHKIAEKRARYD
jgi:hypothetical protein